MYDRKVYLKENVRYLRKKKNLTIERLSKLANIQFKTVENIETGITLNSNTITIIKIAKALDVSVEDLIYKDYRKDEDPSGIED